MNKLYLYNTLTRKKEEFKAIEKGQATFYHCGPTVYWTQHIGNLRGMTCGDIVVRVLRYLDYDVKHVRNYTDVGHLTSDEDLGEDKMEKAAKRDKLSPGEIAEKYIKIFENDTAELNLAEPTKKPKATDFIKEMIEMTQTLIDKGFAYETDLAIYFDISQAKNYTKLSGQKLEENISGAGKAEVSDEGKKQPADFVLWFFKAGAHKNALQYWPSPFNSPIVENGHGFPGWHIECSAMSKKYLGSTVDLHMGGVEHIPVHHTNEIAQSEAANGVKFVNYWLHNEHLLVDNKKMAKSEGTSYSLAEIKEKGFTALALRYFFLQAHYRSKQNFTWEAMRAAQNGLNHLYNQVRELRITNYELGIKAINANFKKKFLAAVNDDLNTPQALAVVQEVLKSDLPKNYKLATVLDFDKVLGLGLEEDLRLSVSVSPSSSPEEDWDDRNKQIIKKFSPEAVDLIKRRKKARQERNFKESDRLRKEIKKLGYAVEDAKDGYMIIKK